MTKNKVTKKSCLKVKVLHCINSMLKGTVPTLLNG